MNAAQTLLITQKIPVTMAPVDAMGLAVDPGAITFQSSNPQVAIWNVDFFGSYYIIPAGVGTCTLTLKSNGPDEVVQVTVNPNPPVTLGLKFGAPIPK